MQPYRMRNSTFNKFILLIFLFLNGAVAGTCGNCDSVVSGQSPWVQPLYDHFGKSLFKVSMDISKTRLTGLMFFKQTSDSTIRVLFSNEMGMNYFDIEFVKSRLIVHNCFPSFTKHGFINILGSDIRLLLPFSFIDEKSYRQKGEETGIINFIVKTNSGKYLFSIDKISRQAQEISSKGNFLRKTRISLFYSGKCLPQKIRIINPVVKMKMNLSLLDN
jgi:hypothetical protein